MSDGSILVDCEAIDVTSIPQGDGSTVQRQRVDVPGLGPGVTEYLKAILIEMRLHSILLAEGFGIKGDLDDLRSSVGDL